jgi:predicted HicB family RNase H-like nuclease
LTIGTSCITIKAVKRRGRPPTGRTPNTSIRVDREALHQARIAAVTARKTLGAWLEEAIQEKIQREQKGEKVTREELSKMVN